MQKLLLVTSNDGFFAQGEMPWSSMDINKLSALFAKKFDVEIVNFNYLIENFNDINNCVVLYTSSQRLEHKRYIEDVVTLIAEKNLIIPTLESLKAHDNKGFQVLMDKKYGLNLIKSDYYSDYTDIRSDIKFPLIYKEINGASSRGVSIVRNSSELEGEINEQFMINTEVIKRFLKKYIFKWKYNQRWYEYLEYAKKRFIIQEFIENLTCDFKVLIFGEKYYVLKRSVADGDFKASGSGIFSFDIEENELIKVLNEAKKFREKYVSNIYSLDICLTSTGPRLIEFQFTHVGPVTLIKSESFYSFNNNTWEKVIERSVLEEEFYQATSSFIDVTQSMKRS
ncbi:hypothetical protein BCS96_10250 [Vibrio breoganii]|uniref:hypothetical protein n=1 Tax=Vibrio breoganii TaxID=553239 RepID=UPI000C860CD0|nr:hypothetical protein [Vibrio breoganii]PMO99172.1 hypothetical protein BCS96_10250 [Vibrio breoganii]